LILLKSWLGSQEYGYPAIHTPLPKAATDDSRPIGDNSFIEEMEKVTGQDLNPGKPGPKPKAKN
jgi:hypothetical protein